MKRPFITALLVALMPMLAQAQLSSNPDKFLGNITTRYNVDAGGGVEPYYKLWNQITCENESKWGSVEGTRNSYNWGCDKAFNYAKDHNFTYKFHALVWGAQYPGWLESLSIKDRYAAIVKWYDAVKKKYDTLPLIDVVNEAVGTHQPGNPMMKESLGGEGKTGYDWLIKAFELAYERWPDAILIYNDYNTFQWDTNNYLDLVRTLRDTGTPIDAYGCQSHDVTDIKLETLKSSMNTLQTGLKMPMYITELDIDIADDQQQQKQYEKIFPVMWEADYCAGVTIWGYIHGATWVDNSGIIKNGKDRPAMTWLRDYMTTEAAKTAKSPFPGMKKEASVYVKPRDLKVAKGDVLPIMVRAKMATKEIEKIDLYVGTELIATMTEAPYYTEYTVPSNSTTGWKTLKAVVTATDSTTYERYSRFNVLGSTTKREPYNETVPELPGTIVVGEYDKGAQGVTYNKASRNAASPTQTGGWMEYTVDVKEDGLYSFDAEVASNVSGGTFHLTEYGFDNVTFLADMIEVPKTGSSSNFQTMHCVMTKPLTAGRHRICLNIDKGSFYIKNLTFQRYEQDKNISVSVSSVSPSTISVDDTTLIKVTASSSTSTIANVKVFANDLLIGTLTEAPYQIEFTPVAKGSYSITAIATDAEGKENVSAKKTLKVNGRRTPYSGKSIALPGIIEAENFDKGGEGLTFHDTDSNREGDVNYRTDGEGVDFVKGNGGTAIGYTAVNEWLEYSVNITEGGQYSYVATVSSGVTGSAFNIQQVGANGKMTTLCRVSVPQTGSNNWDTYKTVTGKISQHLDAGETILRFTIAGAQCNIDKVEFICDVSDGIESLTSNVAPANDGAVYNLAGQRVANGKSKMENGQLPKGVYVVNGKKVLVR